MVAIGPVSVTGVEEIEAASLTEAEAIEVDSAVVTEVDLPAAIGRLVALEAEMGVEEAALEQEEDAVALATVEETGVLLVKRKQAGDAAHRPVTPL